jgi:hypothetical protein
VKNRVVNFEGNIELLICEVADDLTLLNGELYDYRYSQYVEMNAFDVCGSAKKVFED